MQKISGNSPQFPWILLSSRFARCLFNYELRAAILLETVVALFGAEGTLFAVANYLDPGRLNAGGHQRASGGLCPLHAESNVVLCGAPLVSVPGDGDADAGMSGQECGVFKHCARGIWAQISLIIV